MGSEACLYEVVSGQILLNRREEFYDLHHSTLLPIMREVGIEPVLLLITEIGRYGRFLDVYRYPSMAAYEALTDQLLRHEDMAEYYRRVGQCVFGSITVELMRNLPYAAEWTRSGAT